MKPERLACPLVVCCSTAHTLIYDHCRLFYTSSASTIKKKNSQQTQSSFFSPDLNNNNLTCIQLCQTKTDDFAVNFNRRQVFTSHHPSQVWTQSTCQIQETTREDVFLLTGSFHCQIFIFPFEHQVRNIFEYKVRRYRRRRNHILVFIKQYLEQYWTLKHRQTRRVHCS